MSKLTQRTLLCLITGLALYVLFFFWLDRPIDVWIHTHLADGRAFQWGTYISFLAYGPVIRLLLAIGIILAIACDRGRRQRWAMCVLYVCISCAVALVVGDGFKYFLARYRPVMLFDKNLYGLHFFSKVWEINSTPSGHTLRAFAILTALSLLFRRGCVLFMPLAAAIGVSRVIVTAHYPSDVIFGAVIGILSAVWMYRYFIGNKFDSNRLSHHHQGDL